MYFSFKARALPKEQLRTFVQISKLGEESNKCDENSPLWPDVAGILVKENYVNSNALKSKFTIEDIIKIVVLYADAYPTGNSLYSDSHFTTGIINILEKNSEKLLARTNMERIQGEYNSLDELLNNMKILSIPENRK